MRAVLVFSILLASSFAAARPGVTTRLTLAPTRLDVRQRQLAGFDRSITPGQPALPVRELSVALHPNADLSTLTVSIASGPTDTLAGRHELPPNPPLRVAFGRTLRTVWGEAGTVLGGRDLDAYGERLFPAQVVVRRRITNRRGLLVLKLRYTPLRYRHAGAELLLDRHTEVSISYRLRAGGAFAPDPQLLYHLSAVENAAQARGWYNANKADTAAKVGYAIVISDVLARASKQLQAFVQHKEGLGFAVTVVKDADRAAITVGPKGGDAERIRGWLQQSYKKLNLKYALLVGNPDPGRAGVPMKMTSPFARSLMYKDHDTDPVPTDYYYADLTGDWDLDADGVVAEYPDDKGDTGVDFAAEVFVGRVPIYDNNVQALDKILAKFIAYASDKGDRSWRQRVLQPAAMLFLKNEYDQGGYRMDGADVATPIYEQVIKAHGLTRTTLFEAAGLDPSKQASDLPLTPDNLVKEWQKGYGLVTMVGHGSPQGIFRLVWTKDDGNGIPDYGEVDSPPYFSFDDVLKLDDSHPSFVFHNSCSNGYPEEPDNLGYGLLLNGAVGTVSSTRVALVVNDSSIFNVARDAISYLVEHKPIGEALFTAKEKLSDTLGAVSWFTMLEVTLYGDPSLSLTACTTDADCDDAKVCNGKESCQAGQCLPGTPVKCAAADPCVDAACDEATGTCAQTPRPEGEACDDLRFCTINDTCQAGTCVGQPRCAAPGNPCVVSACDERNRTCDVTPTLEGQTCHAGTSREGLCKAGLCEPNDTGCAVGGGRASDLALGAMLLLLVFAVRRWRR
jgi:hypothetical protein